MKDITIMLHLVQGSYIEFEDWGGSELPSINLSLFNIIESYIAQTQA